MKIHSSFTQKTEIPKKMHNIAGKSPFGADSVSIAGDKQMNMISQNQLSQLLKAKRTGWTYAVGFSRQGMMTAKDGSLYIARGERRESSFLKLNGKTGEVEWEKKFDMDIESKPAIEGPDGTIYIRTSDRRLRAFNPANGEEKWNFNMKLGGARPAIGKDGTIYSNLDGDLRVMNPDGEEKFTVEIGDLMHYVASVDDSGNAIVKSEGEIFSLDSQGKEMWRVEGETVDAFSTDPDRIYTATEEGITARDRKTGEKLWDRQEEGLHYKYDIEGSVDNRLFISHGGDKKLKCVDAATGKNLWEKETKLRTRLVGDDGTLYLGGDWKIEAVDPKTGKTRWSVDTEKEARYGEAVLGSNDTLFVNDDKHVYGIETDTGKVVFQYAIDDKITHFSLNEKENMIYITGLEKQKLSAVNLIDLKPFKNQKPEEPQKETSPGEIKVEEQFVEIGGVKLPKMTRG